MPTQMGQLNVERITGLHEVTQLSVELRQEAWSLSLSSAGLLWPGQLRRPRISVRKPGSHSRPSQDYGPGAGALCHYLWAFPLLRLGQHVAGLSRSHSVS